MKRGMSRESWRVIKVGLFLLVTILIVLPYLVEISTFFHEEAHVEILAKYGIKNYHGTNILMTIPNFFNPRVQKLGVTKFDYEQYKKLGPYQKTEVHIAGIISDLKFLFLIGIYLSFTNIYLFYKIRIKKDYDLTWVLAINWILFMWLLVLIQITVANISNSGGDFYQLIKVLSGL